VKMITTLHGSTSNGNGHVTPVGGRGALRRKLSESARVALANDLASGTVSFVPSFAQAARAVGTTPYLMRQARKAYNKALKAEAKRAAKVEATTAITAAVTKFAAAETLLDTPAVRASLRRLAASLGCQIDQREAWEIDEAGDRGPYMLRDVSGYNIWEFGLPVEGIADALKCLAHEHTLPPDRVGEAWVNFSAGWAR